MIVEKPAKEVSPAKQKAADAKAAAKARARAAGTSAHRAFEATFRPRPTAGESCQLIACFFPGLHYCGAPSCPPECPKVSGRPQITYPPTSIVTADRAGDLPRGAPPSASARSGAQEYSAGEHAKTEAIPPQCHADVVTATQNTPENMREPVLLEEPETEPPEHELDAAHETLWHEAADRWVGAEPPPPAASAPAEPALALRNGSGDMPCITCGKIKIVMAVLRDTSGGFYRKCSACYRGATR